MKKLFSMILAVVLFCTTTACSANSGSQDDTQSSTSYNIAVVKLVDHESLNEIADAIVAQLDAIAKDNGIEIKSTVYSGQGDAASLQQIGDEIINSDFNAIVPIATLTAQIMTNVAEDSKTPVIYAAISDPEAAGLLDIDYVTGTSDALDTNTIMEMMLAAQPDIKKVGLLYSQSEKNSELPIAEASEYLKGKGIEVVPATGSNSAEIEQATSALISQNVDVVFTPTDNVVMENEASVAEKLLNAKIPHYTGADSFVRLGAFATCGVNYTDLGTKTADYAYQALTSGMSDMEDYYTMEGGIITVNSETEEALGIDASVFESYGSLVRVETSAE